MKFLFILLSFALFYSIICGKCPSKEVLNPCICISNHSGEGKDAIICGGTTKYDMKRIFHLVSDALGNNEKHFYAFIFNNTAIDIWEEVLFYDVTFESIRIESNTNLTRIHTNSLSSTSLTVKEFLSNSKKLINDPPYYNLFDVLSKCLNMEYIHIAYSNMTSIPEHAFRPIIGIQSKLKSIYFESSNVYKLGNFAFNELPNIQTIVFYFNGLTSIPINAFNIQKSSNETLYIYLSYNNLMDGGLPIGIFLNSKRPSKAYLEGNKLTFLDENIFEPFFNLNKINAINVEYNPLNCSDCRNAWILNDRINMEKKIDGAKCSDGKSFFNNSLLSNCS